MDDATPCDLQAAIAEYLAACAEAVEQCGTDEPELLDAVPAKLRDAIVRQRGRVNATLEGIDPDVHARHVAALAKGVRLAVRRCG